MENQNPRVPPLWEHSLTTLLGHDPTRDPGIALRQWVHFQSVHNILDLLSWDQEELKADTFYTKIPIAPCYCQMMGRTLKEEIKITQYNNPTKAGKYSLEDLFRASDNIPHHYPKF